MELSAQLRLHLCTETATTTLYTTVHYKGLHFWELHVEVWKALEANCVPRSLVRAKYSQVHPRVLVYYQHRGHALGHTYYKDAVLSCTILVRVTSQDRIFSSWQCLLTSHLVLCCLHIHPAAHLHQTLEPIWVMFWRGLRYVVSLNRGHIKDLAFSRR